VVFTAVALIVGRHLLFLRLLRGASDPEQQAPQRPHRRSGRAALGRRRRRLPRACSVCSRSGIGTLIRHSAGAIAAVFGLIFVLPGIVGALPSSWSNTISPYLPSVCRSGHLPGGQRQQHTVAVDRLRRLLPLRLGSHGPGRVQPEPPATRSRLRSDSSWSNDSPLACFISPTAISQSCEPSNIGRYSGHKKIGLTSPTSWVPSSSVTIFVSTRCMVSGTQP